MARETWDINEYRVLLRALSLNLLSKMISQWGSLLNGVPVNVDCVTKCMQVSNLIQSHE